MWVTLSDLDRKVMLVLDFETYFTSRLIQCIGTILKGHTVEGTV